MACIPKLRGLKKKNKKSLRLSQMKMSLIKRNEIDKVRKLLTDNTLRTIEKFSLAVYLKSLLHNNEKIINTSK